MVLIFIIVLEINEIYCFTSFIKYNQVLGDMCIIKGNRREIFLNCPKCNFKYNIFIGILI